MAVRPSIANHIAGSSGIVREEPVFEARRITKIYGIGEAQVQALRGIDIALYAGEFVVLLGPSGSGKSRPMPAEEALELVRPPGADGPFSIADVRRRAAARGEGLVAGEEVILHPGDNVSPGIAVKTT